MKKEVVVCDLCGKETSSYYTGQMPRPDTIKFIGGINGKVLAAARTGTNMEETDLCRECASLIADLFIDDSNNLSPLEKGIRISNRIRMRKT